MVSSVIHKPFTVVSHISQRRSVCEKVEKARPLAHNLGRLDLRQEESQGGFKERDGSVQEGCVGR